MRINGSDLNLAHRHGLTTQHERRERLEHWVGARPRQAEGTVQPSAAERPEQAGAAALNDLDRLTERLAKAAKRMLKAPVVATPSAATDSGKSAAVIPSEPDPKTKQVLSILEKVFGIKNISSYSFKIDTSHVQAQGATAAAEVQQSGFGIAYDYHESYLEYERSTLSAAGTITLDDGRSFSLKLDLMQERLFQSSIDVSYRAGDAKLADPLALDLDGRGLRFGPEKMSLDLTGDGIAESVNQLLGKGRWLAMDRNHDGKVSGDELFGTHSGDGFADLRQLDDDHNGWLDAGDIAFRQLLLWDGRDQLTPLGSANIGALGLTKTDATFRYTDARNETLAINRSAGVFLREDGTAGRMNQVDLKV